MILPSCAVVTVTLEENGPSAIVTAATAQW